MRFAWIHHHRQTFDVASTCELLAVSRQGDYAWQARQQQQPSASELRRQELMRQIRQAHEASDGTYGSPRVQVELAEKNVACCVNTVARLMRKAGLRANTPRRFVPLTTDSRHDQPVFENRLERDFSAELPNRKWVCDITYVSTNEGFLYLAGAGLRPRTAVMDLCSRKIVGSLNGRPPACRAVPRCLEQGHPDPNAGSGPAAPQRPGRAVCMP